MTEGRHPVEFKPAAGATILIQPSGLDRKLKTFFIGMEAGRYLVASLAPLMAELSDLSRYFERGHAARVFFSRKGVVQGYMVQVQGLTTTPFRHLYLTYPHEGAAYNLRQHDRVESHLPGVVKGENWRAKCMVTDLSAGGCGVLVDPDHVGRFDGLEPGEHLLLRFQLNTCTDISEASCQLAAVRDSRGKRSIGLRFTYVDDETADCIGEFIRFVAEYRI